VSLDFQIHVNTQFKLFIFHPFIIIIVMSSTTPKPRVYFSFDIEADGPSPALNSMVSFGCVVFDESGVEVDKMQANMLPLPEQTVDKRCKEEFWDKNPEILKFVQTNPVDPSDFVKSLVQLYKKYKDVGHKIVWVANPAAYDWQWLKAYYEWFKCVEDPDIGYSAKCIGTMLEVYRLRMKWTDDQADEFEARTMKKLEAPGHVAHNPEHDARVQGHFFFTLCNALMQ